MQGDVRIWETWCGRDTQSLQLVRQVLGGVPVPWWYEPPMFLGNRNKSKNTIARGCSEI